MRIMVFSMDFKPSPGGIAEYVHRVALGLQRFGDQVVVVGPAIEGAEDFDTKCGYPVVRMNVGDEKRRMPWQRLGRHLGRRRLFRQVLEAHRVEHVFFGQWGALSWEASRWTKRAGLDYSVLVHGKEVMEGFQASMPPKGVRRGLRDASVVFVNSRYTAQVVREVGVGDERIKLAWPGVDPDEFSLGEVSQEERRRLGIAGRKVVLTVCRLVERKGVDRSLEAMVEVSKKVPEVMYLVCGDGPDRGRLEGIVRRLRLQDRVRFVGHREGAELVELYRACDCFLMPARELPGGDVETFGIVFLEANACGKPVIGGRSGGMVEAVSDGRTGLLVDPERPGEIGEAVIRLLTDKALAARLGEEGRRRAEKEMAWEPRVGEMRSALVRAGEAK